MLLTEWRQYRDLDPVAVASRVGAPRLIDGLVARLEAFRDADLRRELQHDKERVAKLVKRFFYCG